MRAQTIWLLVAVITMTSAQAVWGEPMRLARSNFSLRRPSPSVSEIPAIQASLPGGPVTVNVANEALLKETMQTEMVEFVQRNYPSHAPMAMRSLQREEGRVYKQFEDSVEFLKEFAQGPVTIEGAFREIRGTLQYVITGTIRGVDGHPKATLKFETYPGLLRPVTDVSLDEDGDGTVDDESTGFCRLDRLWDWIEERLPQAA